MKLSARDIRHKLSHMEAHHRLLISLAFAALVFLLIKGRLHWSTELIVTWDAYALCVLALAWTRIVTAQPRVVVKLATLQPSSRKFIFLFVIVVACASLSSVGCLLGMARGLTGWKFGTTVTLALVTVILSWLVLHTVFALHYAYLFYREHHSGKAARIARGLVFPDGEIEPDYYDFAYFSFVIGMTSQVSDVQINAREIRRWALLHDPGIPPVMRFKEILPVHSSLSP